MPQDTIFFFLQCVCLQYVTNYKHELTADVLVTMVLTDWFVYTQLCKLRDTSGSFVYIIFMRVCSAIFAIQIVCVLSLRT